MFNLNENHRFVMSQQPSDMRAGVNKLCGEVRSVGMDPTNGDVYVFVGSSRKLMKLLHWERGGYVMYYKRLEQGRFHRKYFCVLCLLLLHQYERYLFRSLYTVENEVFPNNYKSFVNQQDHNPYSLLAKKL